VPAARVAARAPAVMSCGCSSAAVARHSRQRPWMFTRPRR
jgi:hypothetical protein